MEIRYLLATVFVGMLLVACSSQTPGTTDTPNVTPSVPSSEQTPTVITPDPQPPTPVPPKPQNNTSSSSTGTTKPTPKPSGITATELAAHATRDSCWVAYKGEVYDVTAFIPKHPGGASRITRYCGTAEEFTQAFNAQHGTRMDSRLARESKIVGAYLA